MVNALSRYLRMSINKGEQIVSLEEEIQLMRTYIEIMQKRFQNKFEVFYEVEQDTLQIPIPKLSLQPLVENALLHGISVSYTHLDVYKRQSIHIMLHRIRLR